MPILFFRASIASYVPVPPSMLRDLGGCSPGTTSVSVQCRAPDGDMELAGFADSFPVSPRRDQLIVGSLVCSLHRDTHRLISNKTRNSARMGLELTKLEQLLRIAPSERGIASS